MEFDGKNNKDGICKLKFDIKMTVKTGMSEGLNKY